MPQSKHAAVRAQQRAIPPIVDRLLDEFGEEEHDGYGGIRVFFSRRSERAMARVLGTQPAGLLKRYLRAYRVESSRDGKVITMGWRTKAWRRA